MATVKGSTCTVEENILSSFRLLEDLIYNSNQIPFYAEQLALLTNVKRSTDEFDLTVSVLLTNAQNLMRSITKSLDATEALLVKVITSATQYHNTLFAYSNRWLYNLSAS